MARLSATLRSVEDGGIAFYCPGCNSAHVIYTGAGAGSRWGYNGNPESPTFTPSVLVRSGHFVPGHEAGTDCWCTWKDKDEFTEMKCTVCHSFVTNGQILFLGDCTHPLAGQTVPLPEFPNDYAVN